MGIKAIECSTFITSIKVKCEEYWRGLDSGDRIAYLFAVGWNTETGRPYNHLFISGTIMQRKKNGKLRVWVDENDYTKPIVNLLPSLVNILEEPKVKVCPMCYKPEGKINSEKFCCITCDSKEKQDKYNLEQQSYKHFGELDDYTV